MKTVLVPGCYNIESHSHVLCVYASELLCGTSRMTVCKTCKDVQDMVFMDASLQRELLGCCRWVQDTHTSCPAPPNVTLAEILNISVNTCHVPRIIRHY